jgi:hypothetical protein
VQCHEARNLLDSLCSKTLLCSRAGSARGGGRKDCQLGEASEDQEARKGRCAGEDEEGSPALIRRPCGR